MDRKTISVFPGFDPTTTREQISEEISASFTRLNAGEFEVVADIGFAPPTGYFKRACYQLACLLFRMSGWQMQTRHYRTVYSEPIK